MRSIDNLREYALTAASVNATTRAVLAGYIDGIEREVAEVRTAAYNEGYDAGFASADDWAAQHEDAMAEHGWMRKSKEHVVSYATIEVTPHIDCSRHGWRCGVTAPERAKSSIRTDGLRLRRNQMQFTDEQQRFIDEHYQLLPLDADGEAIHAGDMLDGYGKTIEVVELRYGRSGWVIVSRDGNAYADTFAFTHHHVQTVEDVLREFYVLAVRGKEAHAEDVDADVLTEYAAKLRLAGDE